MGQEESTLVNPSGPPLTLDARALPAVADYIKSDKVKRVVVLTGAGISTAAGIPDFRSPKTGLYNNLARLNLPYAEAVFDISYFREHPEPFYVLAQELYPGKFHPTVSHAFITLLAQKGLLQMLFTQNIDCLERAAGVPSDKIVEAHGSFASQRCIECRVEFPDDDMKAHVLKGEVPRCKDDKCNGLVKPDITFFGEALPREFSEKSHHAVMADLVLIIGTSLSVYPFASLPEMVRESTPRVLFNMEQVGMVGGRKDDVLELGSCDDGIRKLADLLGWRDELEKLWRSIVGDTEAERQLRSQAEREEEVEDEVQKLTDGIESALKLEEDKEESRSDNKDKEVDASKFEGDVLTLRTDSVESSVEETAASPEHSQPKQADESKLETTNSSETPAALSTEADEEKVEHEKKSESEPTTDDPRVGETELKETQTEKSKTHKPESSL